MYLFRLLLRLYPAGFRSEYGNEMYAVFAEKRKRASGIFDVIYVWSQVFVDVFRHAIPMHADVLRQDIGYSVRSLLRAPVLSVAVVVISALGIGANTAVFSVLNSVVLNPLPYDEPDQLVRIYSATERNPAQTGYLSGYDFPFMRDEVSGFETAAVMLTYRETGTDLTDGERPQRVRTLQVSSGYFETYRATPLFGRTFTRDEEIAEANVVVLSHGLWRAYTNEDVSIVGETIALDGNLHTVIGVMRPTFRDIVGGDVSLWLPLDLDEGGWNDPGNQYLTGIARLAQGTTLVQAQAQVDAFQQHMSNEFPEAFADQITRLVPLHADTVGNTGSILYLLWGAAGLVLLIACVNVASITFARSEARTKEIAIRAALGSGRGRLAAHSLIESVIVAAIGGIAGICLAYWGVMELLSISPESLPRAEEVSFDTALLVVSLAATLITGLLSGAAPAIRAAKVAPYETLRHETRGNTVSRRGRHIGSVLVATQMSLSFILLIGTGLLVRSFFALRQVDIGVNPANVSTFEVHLPDSRYPEGEDRSLFHRSFLERLRAHPLIERAGATSWLPANGRYHSWSFGLETGLGEPEGFLAQVRTVEGDYFQALGIDVLAGRVFDHADRLDTDRVALINERLANQAFGDESPVGKLLRSGSGEYTVIGVVSNVSHEIRGTVDNRVYLSHSQMSDDRNWAMTYVLKTTASPGNDITNIARRELAAIDGALVVHSPSTLSEVLHEKMARDRFVLALMAVFACIAVSLAAVGTYGVLSYSVNQRIHEIGIRMALGAKPGQVRMIVVGQTAAVTCVGIGVGLAGAFGFSRLMHSMLFGVSVTDLLVFSTVPMILAVVAAIAMLIPAHKATRVNPVRALSAV